MLLAVSPSLHNNKNWLYFQLKLYKLCIFSIIYMQYFIK